MVRDCPVIFRVFPPNVLILSATFYRTSGSPDGFCLIFEFVSWELLVLGEKGVGDDRAALTHPGGIATLVLGLDLH